MTLGEARQLLGVYSAGFVAVFGVLALLHLHAFRRRGQLGLDALGRLDALAGAKRHAMRVAVGLLAFVLAFVLPGWLLWLSGAIFALLGPVHATYGFATGRARAALAAEPAAR
jgi:hypothetical protein